MLGFHDFNAMRKHLHQKISLLVFVATLAIATGVSAQDSPEPENPFVPQTRVNQRALGDQSFGITVGLLAPLSITMFTDGNSGHNPPQLTVGGVGGLAYSVYLSQNIKLGLNVTGSFTYDVNRNLLYLVPITFKGVYEFHPWNRITIPLSLGLGVSLNSWKDEFHADLIVRPGIGFYFDWNVEWSFGIDTSYWMVPQIYPNASSQNAIAHFMDVTLTAEYHF